MQGGFSADFTDLTVIGEGAFGKVYKAMYKQEKFVAVKKIKFQNSQEGVPATALRQISLLKSLRDHPNIVGLIDVIYKHKERNLSLVFEFFDYDLRNYLKTKKQDLAEYEVKLNIYQILNAVAFCHSRKIMHRDLKPQNILIDMKGNIKIADFGLARLLPIPLKTLTHQIQTVWYRAPQILLGTAKYSFSVDIWAVGCIFAELIDRKPLFPGSGSQIQQIFIIFKYFGTPGLADWQNLAQLPDFKPTFPKWKKTGNIKKNFSNRLSPEGIDLLQQLLTYNPTKRITAQQALDHPYFGDLKKDDIAKYTHQL